jgi:hypothetical protein
LGGVKVLGADVPQNPDPAGGRYLIEIKYNIKVEKNSSIL